VDSYVHDRREKCRLARYHGKLAHSPLAKRLGLVHRGGVARSFRLVCEDHEIPLVEALLCAEGFAFRQEPFSPLCRLLTREPAPLGASLAARFGLIYIQDRSSMLPPLALAPDAGSCVLDMCASPGGKTSFLAQLSGREGFVLAGEPSSDRLATLRRNLACMNLPQVVTCGAKGQELPLPEESFGHILLDPPCSGWGTVEKNPRVATLWTPEKIGPLVALQRELLAKAASLLAPGGRLLYSTCTTNRAENEEQVVWATGELGLALTPLPPFPGFCFHEPLLPGAAGSLRVDGEGSGAQGFYLALLTKPEERRDESTELTHAAAPGRSAGESREACCGVRGDHPPAGVQGRSPWPAGVRGQSPWPVGVRGQSPWPVALPAGALDDEGLAWENLPPGFFEMFKDELCFLPERGRRLLPARRKGQRLGQARGGVFRPWARARLLVPKSGSGGPKLVVEEPSTLKSLLAGRSIEAAGKNFAAKGRTTRLGLYWWELPLGFVSVKGGRILWSDR